MPFGKFSESVDLADQFDGSGSGVGFEDRGEMPGQVRAQPCRGFLACVQERFIDKVLVVNALA
ncbi:MAG: hypothetical protein R2789_14450 [Microthrixaceae bacterium]